MKPENPSDKRRSKREKAFIAAWLGDLKVYITDISSNGCQVFLEEESFSSEEGADIFLKVELPSHKEKKEPIELIGSLAWQRSMEKFLLIGIDFTKLSQEKQKLLRKVVNHWNFLNSTFGSF